MILVADWLSCPEVEESNIGLYNHKFSVLCDEQWFGEVLRFFTPKKKKKSH